MALAQIIDTARSAQDLTVVGLLICGLIGTVSALIYVFRLNLKSHEGAERQCREDRERREVSIDAMQKESIGLRMEQVRVMERMNNTLRECAAAIALNNRLLDADAKRRITGRRKHDDEQ